MTVAAAVLAAGGGTRFQGPEHKLLTPFRGRPLVAWAIDAAVAARLDAVFVVSGAADLAGCVPEGVRLAHNERWAEGQATSLALAIDVAHAGGFDALVVGLGDQPLVLPEAWRAVALAGSPIAVATYDGTRGNPVRLARDVWPLVDAEGDQGARGLMRRRPDLVGEVACSGSAADVDTLEDLELWS